ncbi:hypothetical protein [Haladaptatus sp. ZSTT2]|uniref:hypothetical protein n=1 Tax=Haladaptatus sp. ZSTT2 TaxID=3120515 RepID=UPI00300F5F28
MTASPRIEWSVSGDTSRVVRALSILSVSAFTAIILLFVAFLALIVPLVLASARPAVIALFVLLLLVGGPGSILYLWPMLTDKSQRPAFAPFEFPGVDGWRQIVPPAVLLAVVFGLAFLADGRAFYGIFAFTFLLLVVTAALSGEGWLDPERGELHVGTTISLALLDGIQPVHVGDVTLCYLSYASGASRLTSPRLLAVPTERFDDLRPHLESGHRKTSPRTRATRPTCPRYPARVCRVFLRDRRVLLVRNRVQTSTRLYIVAAVALLGSLFVLVAVFEA